LEDLDKANVLEPNITFILSNHGYVKNILKDYQRALEDFHKVDVLKPKNAFILIVMKMSKTFWKIIKEPWRTLAMLMSLNQTMLLG
jgi:hypothetical protein